MGILTWIVVGLIAGWLAGQVMSGSGYGVIGDILIGIAGALVGGFLATALFGVGSPIDGFNLSTVFVAFIGAVILIFAVRALPGRASV